MVVALMSCVGTGVLWSGDAISASESQTEPWAESLDPDREPRPFEDVCLAGPEVFDRVELPPAELRRWLEAVSGHPFHVRDERVRNRAFCGFEGLGKLRARWASDAVLRLTPYKLEQLSIHVWSGNAGISVKYFRSRSPHLLAAYRTTRNDGQPRPASPGHLLASDDGRYFRSNLGAFELRFQDDSLVLSRGSIRLLTVPFAGVPEEVYLEGKFKLRDLSMYRSTPVPETAANARPVVLSSDEPAGLLRKVEPPDVGRLVTALGGSVELSTNDDTGQERGKAALVWSGTLIGPRRLYEVIVLVEDAQPGTGVYLGNADLQPVHCVGFFRDRKTSGTCFGHTGSGAEDQLPSRVTVEADVDPKRVLPTYTDGTQWLRIVVGSGSVRVWTSGDGRHWGWATAGSAYRLRSGCSSIGLYAVPGKERRSIKLRKLVVRELAAITSLADADLKSRVPVYDLTPMADTDFGTWLHKVIQTRPDDVPMAAWRQACAAGTLEAGATQALHDVLLAGLLSDGLAETDRLEDGLNLLEEAALLSRLEDWHTALRFHQSHEALGRRLLDQEAERSFRRVSQALLDVRSPCAVAPAIPEILVANQLLDAVDRTDWESVHDLLRQLRSWTDTGDPHRRWWDRMGAFPICRRKLVW